MEASHIPISKWVLAMHLMASSKKGMSAHQLHRMLDVTYRTAWFMAHRLRYAMAHDALFGAKLSGTVAADETYIGGKQKGRFATARRYHNKTSVVALVERKGRVRAFPMERVTTGNMQEAIRARVHLNTHMMTDAHHAYDGLRRARHDPPHA